MALSDQEDNGQAETDEVAEEAIVEHIFEAIIEQRLPPGTKLSESALCEAFGVGRMRIRRSLLLLASREVVDLRANRGAFVASPTAEQAAEIFEARLILEPDIARLAVERATDADLDMLARHLEEEYEAHRQGRRNEAIRLSGQFHVHLCQIAGNSVMLRMMKELVTRTSLIIGIYGAPGMVNCRDDDHAAIADAIRARDADKASRMMRLHLKHIQEHLDLSSRKRPQLDLVTILKR
jgi:DNA-binding GntR family transcriptional regulator